MTPDHATSVEIKLEVRDLHVWFERRHAVRGISLDVADRKTVALIGAAGSGRSAILRALNRLLDLDATARVEGSIKIDGAEVLAPTTNVPALRRRMGMIFREPATLPLSVYENVAFGLRAKGANDQGTLDGAIERALRQVMLWDSLQKQIHEPALALPLDWQQRICIARALAVGPEVLLFDDPSSKLDPVASAQLDDVIFRLRRDFTILIATNDLHQAARLSDLTFYMIDGEIAESGETLAIFNRPTDSRTEDFLAGRAWS